MAHTGVQLEANLEGVVRGSSVQRTRSVIVSPRCPAICPHKLAGVRAGICPYKRTSLWALREPSISGSIRPGGLPPRRPGICPYKRTGVWAGIGPNKRVAVWAVREPCISRLIWPSGLAPRCPGIGLYKRAGVLAAICLYKWAVVWAAREPGISGPIRPLSLALRSRGFRLYKSAARPGIWIYTCGKWACADEYTEDSMRRQTPGIPIALSTRSIHPSRACDANAVNGTINCPRDRYCACGSPSTACS